MQLVINGQTKKIFNINTLADLLMQLQLVPERVVVEHNGNILTADQHQQTLLNEGDRLELVQFVGGG